DDKGTRSPASDMTTRAERAVVDPHSSDKYEPTGRSVVLPTSTATEPARDDEPPVTNMARRVSDDHPHLTVHPEHPVKDFLSNDSERPTTEVWHDSDTGESGWVIWKPHETQPVVTLNVGRSEEYPDGQLPLSPHD